MDLTFENVTKFYGPVIGVNDVSCRVRPGITALFGANGAGKSTMIKLASGQLRPSLGRVRIGDRSTWSTAAKRHFGYSPDVNSFYEEMSGREFVYVMARLYGYSRGEAKRRAEDALERVGMAARASRPIGGFSHGMRQRIKLAQSLVNDPEVFLLDEPMSGIDPGGRRDFHRLLKELADAGKTILVSTHMLSEVEDLADVILMMARGRIIAFGSLAEIRAMLDDEPLTVGIVSPDARRLAALLVETTDVRSVDVQNDVLTIRTRTPDIFFQHLADHVISHKIDVRRLETLDAGADAVFSYLQRGA